ncbi:hypothetical protein [Actinomadura terrae]|uniref:hypothetical protein n=1 Tax=Actinomadura terrae TaxID=604353 RepID=UPI001FA79A13|nr:hypothetical protein [Actinomadura terrae]
MSDQGERGVRWTEADEGDTGGEPKDSQAGAETDVPRMAFPEAKVPEVRVPPPAGRTEFSEPVDPAAPARQPAPAQQPGPVPHDVWGKVEGPPAPPPAPAPAAPEPELPEAVLPELTPQPEPAPPAPPAPEPMTFPPAPPEFAAPAAPPSQPGQPGQPEPPAPGEAEDVKVAPVPEESAQQWEGSLFEDGEGGDPRYQTAVPTGVGGPARPGKPSSGNWQMPDWMADEAAADAKLGGSPAPARDELDGGGKGRIALFGGVGLLVVALVAAGGLYLLKGGDEEKAKPQGKKSHPPAARQEPQPQPQNTQVKMPPDKRLRTFSGRPSRVLGRVTDARAGLAWPRLGPPWQVPGKRAKVGTPGWSGQQVMVSERRGRRVGYGQFLTNVLPPALQGEYQGPGNVKSVAGQAAKQFEEQYYGFPHRTTPLASQALTVDGHRGWLVASYLTYKRSGVKATGEIVATAVIDTGRPTPAVVLASLPNTSKQVWPDLQQFFAQTKVVA